MKKLFLLVLLASFFATNINASHNMGGEITYKYIGANSYEITTILYTDCIGVPPGASINVNMSSVSCSANQILTLSKVYTKDISQVCDTMLLSCNGGTYPGLYETMYRDTVMVVPPCSDWVLSYSLCCRGLPNNLTTPTANFYIETTFDNTVYINESPYFADSPRWMIPVNGLSRINAGAYDADGDSLHYSLVAPKTNNLTNVNYAASYSATQPFGVTPTSIDPKTGIVSTLGQNSGQFLIAVKVDEYRDGQWLSSTVRDFTTNVYVNPDPLPEITNSTLNISACTVDTVSLDIYSSDANDTITTSILYPFPTSNLPYFSNTSAPLNENTDYLLDTNNLTWDLAGLAPNKEYIVYINVEENKCPIKHIQSYAVVVSTSYCVWPGDANNDLIADAWDVLPIGVFNGTTGTTRPMATLNWEGQWSPNWGVTQGSGDDIKHIDCNGDAVIDANDTSAILLNYNLTHTKSINVNAAGPNDPDLFVDIVPDTIGTSAPLAIPIHLGTSLTPADSVYGVAMRISYDKNKIDSIAGVTVDYSNSWLGTKGVNLITLDTNFYDNGFIDVALVRNDGQMISGFGELLTLNVITIDNLSGKSATYGALNVDFIKATIINLNEELRPHNQIEDSVIIKGITSGLYEPLNANAIKVLPNPNNGIFKIYSASKDVVIEMYNLSGKLIDVSTNYSGGYFNVDMTNAIPGMYILKIQNESSIVTKKVIIN